MYFLRFTVNPQADLERGYSFAGYMLFDIEEQAIEEFSLYGDEEYVAQDNVTGMWGRRLSGLCGFGPFESVEEAVAVVDEYSGNYGGQVVIYQGIESWDPNIDGADDEGVRFNPIAIARII